ncbi:MAG TPA: ATP-binding protein [Myxococcota bacterium]|nr:ATP-binding protein [Myxococcota bacterium]
MRRTGLQAEVLISLALLMLAATGVVASVTRSADEARLRDVVARSLGREARAPGPPTRSIFPGTLWWRVEADAPARPWGALVERIDPVTLEVAHEARRRHASVVRPGAGGEPVRYARELSDGAVVVARLPEAASEGLRAVPADLLLGLLAVDAAVFTAFGFLLLRRRVVRPLHQLGQAARTLADGDLRVRVPEQGVRETAELALSFNEMGEALAQRTEALEKAVADLRATNRELYEAREGLHRAERLASVGHLAAGVAHEVGNPIGAILAFVDLAKRDAGISDATRRHLERAAEQGGRVRTILRQLLDFSRPTEARARPVDLAAVAEEAAGLVKAQRRYAGVDLRVERDADAPLALADPGAAGQVLLNLLLNAGDALTDAGVEAPTIRVTVRGVARRRRAGDPPHAEPPRRTPDGVECVVADNGPGVAEADRERIFDPFFTTKDPGAGTGLGLANAQRLLESQGGALALVSPGALGGASFHVVLPAAPAGDGQGVRGEA